MRRVNFLKIVIIVQLSGDGLCTFVRRWQAFSYHGKGRGKVWVPERGGGGGRDERKAHIFGKGIPASLWMGWSKKFLPGDGAPPRRRVGALLRASNCCEEAGATPLRRAQPRWTRWRNEGGNVDPADGGPGVSIPRG